MDSVDTLSASFARIEDWLQAEATSSTRPTLLVVEDDDPVTRSLVRLLKAHVDFEIARTVAEARALAGDAHRFSGLILDITLPDGSGLDVLAELREHGLTGPVLVLSGHFEKKLVAEAQLHGAEYLPKPMKVGHLLAFAQRVSAFARNDEPRVQRFIELFAQRHKLTPRETEVVSLAFAKVPRHEIQSRLGISHETLKTQIRAVLRKADERSMAELTARMRKEMR